MANRTDQHPTLEPIPTPEQQVRRAIPATAQNEDPNGPWLPKIPDPRKPSVTESRVPASSALKCCGRPMVRQGNQLVCGRCGSWTDTGAMVSTGDALMAKHTVTPKITSPRKSRAAATDVCPMCEYFRCRCKTGTIRTTAALPSRAGDSDPFMGEALRRVRVGTAGGVR